MQEFVIVSSPWWHERNPLVNPTSVATLQDLCVPAEAACLCPNYCTGCICQSSSVVVHRSPARRPMLSPSAHVICDVTVLELQQSQQWQSTYGCQLFKDLCDEDGLCFQLVKIPIPKAKSEYSAALAFLNPHLGYLHQVRTCCNHSWAFTAIEKRCAASILL